MAPHTSGWDFLIGKLALNAIGSKSKFIIKKEFFIFPLGLFLKALGAIPIDRSKNSHVLQQSKKIFQSHEQVVLCITPEGTRKKNSNWKKGFYFIALKNELPVLLTTLNYKDKIAAIDDYFYPSGDYQADLKIIREYYKNAKAKYPEQFALPK